MSATSPTKNLKIGDSVRIIAGISNVGEIAIIEDIWTKEKCVVVIYPNEDIGTKDFEDVEKTL